MTGSRQFLLIAGSLTILLSSDGVWTLKCYHQSELDGAKHNSSQPDCGPIDNPTCVKVTTTTNGNVVTARACTSHTNEMKCSAEKTAGLTMESCFCNSDFCNVASTSTGLVPPLIFGFVAFSCN
ncbi:uncharacterized protein LOC129589697 [Paramacrobiotus metropolitanus]|uniref:uncharacterized protein LOC129589697 n=1 Tax=Paramacrobiotus metropolitanus TaxID=2943436 RepID=UPI0024457609|nr:uncharacterized protein LOC129589697 [Paramacrobiotus metropolitanus]